MADAVVVTDAAEGPDEVAWLDRTPRLGREDQARVGPRRAETFAVALLSLAAVGQCSSSQPEKRKIPAARTGLDRPDVKVSLNALHLLSPSRCRGRGWLVV